MTGFPVKLYVYDLSKGLARQMSRQLVGKQIDGVWHTSVVYNNVEYYYGAGVQTAAPGSTHHGQPLEIVDMSESSLPEDIVREYIGSLAEIYTQEKYDLFMHNCNNFSQDLCQFLVGRDIPPHISNLPREVLETPFGQMMRPVIENSLRPITTAPSSAPFSQTPTQAPARAPQQQTPQAGQHAVIYTTSASELDNMIKTSKCSTVFFTSATCGPCRIAYPKYDQLAEEYGDKCKFIKVDINDAYDIATRWRISATPTFMTFISGEKLDEWKGASPPTLESNVQMLLQAAYPVHPHRRLRLPILLGTPNTPISYAKLPPLDKIVAKLAGAGINDPIISHIADFVRLRSTEGAREAPVPDLSAWAAFVQKSLASSESGSGENLFPIIDLFRIAAVDVRVGSWFAEEHDLNTIKVVIDFSSRDESPFQVRLVTLQLLCNLFSSPLFAPLLISKLGGSLAQLAAKSLLDDHVNVRLAASSLAFNIVAYGQKRRASDSEEVLLGQDIGIELIVALIEGIGREEESGPTLGRLLLSLGLIFYCAPLDKEIGVEAMDICASLDAYATVKGKKTCKVADKKLCDEVMQLLTRP
ncbi:PPPDE putative peptidase domain-containing protein [Myxozyma melibiosi]|uniref:PPPDE putative peptidase domain-containing protein n=1 Tax=Myxozyma melibiosi TaxID=54550 RepID=A0ABR1F0N5_9ASCO